MFELEDVTTGPSPAATARVIAKQPSNGRNVTLRFTRLSVKKGLFSLETSNAFAWAPSNAPYSVLAADVANGALATLEPPVVVCVPSARRFVCVCCLPVLIVELLFPSTRQNCLFVLLLHITR